MCLIEDQSWIDCIDITSRWDTFVLFHLYGNKEVSLPLWPIRPRWFHTYSPCAEPLGDGHEGMWVRFGSQGSIALNWHSRYSGTRYSGTWLYFLEWKCSTFKYNFIEISSLSFIDDMSTLVEVLACCNQALWLTSLLLMTWWGKKHGVRFNIMMSSYLYRNPHYKDKTHSGLCPAQVRLCLYIVLAHRASADMVFQPRSYGIFCWP